MENTISPDQLLEEMGGCGRFQVRLSILVHMMKTATAWSILTMAMVSKTPSWWCADDITAVNVTSYLNQSTTSHQSCKDVNGSMCERFEFDSGMKTIVSEFGLVCDSAFIPSTIMSIQTAGMFLGNPLSGQIADLIGRKRPFFIALVMLTVFNLVGLFSTNWIMFAVCRFFIGIGSAFFLTVLYSLLSEFSLASWRPWITGFPSWPIQDCAFSFVGWLLHDWRYMQLSCCIVSALSLLGWKLIPESFRWYLSHDRHKDAHDVIKRVAKVNKQPIPDMTNLLLIDQTTPDDDRKYTFLDLFKHRHIAKLTILCSSNWLALGFVSYGLLFGIKDLSGNLYLNLFLFQIISIPANCMTSYLLNRIGRKKTSLFCFTVACVCGIVVGIVQYIDTDYRDKLTTGFALVANIGISAAWPSVQTMTIELYPTVIRNIGYGSLSTIARVGAIIGPQMAFLNTIVPGTLYFMSGGISALCIIALMFLPETKGRHLQDRIKETELCINQM